MANDSVAKTILDNGFHEFKSEHYTVSAFDSSWYVMGDLNNHGFNDEGMFEGDRDEMMELMNLLQYAILEMEGRCGCGRHEQKE